MSSKSCVQKTNQQMFGWIGKLIRYVGTPNGVKATIHICVTTVIVLMVVLGGLKLAVNYMHPMSDSFSGVMAGLIVIATSIIAASISIYSVLLWDNCNGKS